jgi:SAM-dependent methyltransferase
MSVAREAGAHQSDARQDAHFAEADAAHFRWTTTDRAFAPVEDALLLPRLAALPFPCLEVGCGEGTNLARLAHRGSPVGVDRSADKARFAGRALPRARVLAADAFALPFRSGAFAGVLVRDLLHHLDVPEGGLREVGRVLRPGGTLVLLEPTGRNPLIALQAALMPVERGIRRFSPGFVEGLFGGLPFADVVVETAQALPLRRVMLHYRFGLPVLGRIRAAARVLAAAERLGGAALACDRWSYIAVRARRV